MIHPLDIKIEKGMNVLVSGPNAGGKTSLFRIIAGIWPLESGKIGKPLGTPLNGGIFFVPQKCYLPLGTLRDQVIYPHTKADLKKKNITDKVKL